MSTALKFALAHLDARLGREVRRLRTRYQLTLDEFRGLYVSDDQVDALLAGGAVDSEPPTEVLPPFIVTEPWIRLATEFDLSLQEQEVLLLAVAADIDPRYPPVFAYLNDDVAMRWPTFDLARRLFGRSEHDAHTLSHCLAPDGKLFGSRLLGIVDRGSDRRSAVLTPFAAAPSVADVVTASAPRLHGTLRFVTDEPTPWTVALDELVPLLAAAKRPLVMLSGDWGSGRRASARVLTGKLGYGLLALNIAPGATREEVAARLPEAVLEARLRHCALYLDVETLTPDAAYTVLAEAPVPVFLAAAQSAERWALIFKRVHFAIVPFAAPDPLARGAMWTQALAQEGLAADADAIAQAADAYRLTPGRIAMAASRARLSSRTPRGAHAKIAGGDLLGAARAHAALDLTGLAQPLRTDSGWDDLVLPHGTMCQIKDFARSILHRERVFREWGFARATAPAGLAALLAGASGTGKTMSASVIARETGLDLWRIDLSAVVSKYIGETEKHLDQIFRTARDGNAILFFDEADALFGKRSEVKDAHDRYANIEISYLLQRLEEHDGVSLLATNLAKNVDAAFSRRIHAMIEFPLPDPPLRERLWRKTLAGAPLARDIDFEFLARQFTLAGGDIRITCLDAAFVAAAQEGPISMAILIQAVARQFQKQGRIPSATEFRHYYPHLAGTPRASVA